MTKFTIVLMNLYILLVSIKGQTAEEATEQRGRDGGKLLLKVIPYSDVAKLQPRNEEEFLSY